MKKLGFLIAFSALFAIGMKAQTANPPKKTPTPRAVVTSKPQPQATATSADNAPAKNTVAASGRKRKHTPVRAATVSKPVDGTTAPKQKVN